MDKDLKSLKRVEYIEGTVIILIGILFVAFSSFVSSFLSIILGVLITISGIIIVFNTLLEKKYMSMPLLRFTIGFLMIVFGIASFVDPMILISFTANIIGIIVLIVAIYKLFTAISLTRSENTSVLTYLEAIINFAFSMFMFFFPADANNLIVVVIGCYLVYFGITFIVSIKKSTFLGIHY